MTPGAIWSLASVRTHDGQPSYFLSQQGIFGYSFVSYETLYKT